MAAAFAVGFGLITMARPAMAGTEWALIQCGGGGGCWAILTTAGTSGMLDRAMCYQYKREMEAEPTNGAAGLTFRCASLTTPDWQVDPGN